MYDVDIKQILTAYLRRLTNLSATNQSIYLPRPSTSRHIDVQSLSYLNRHESFSIIDSLIGSRSIAICPIADPQMPVVNKTSMRLNQMIRTDKFITEETGAKDLHVGWPFVEGKYNDGSPVRCPLLFFPVRLEKNKNWTLFPQDKEIVLNTAFLLSYSFHNQITLEESLLEKTFENRSPDSLSFCTELYETLKDSLPSIHFDRSLYHNRLLPFESIRREDFDLLQSPGKLKLTPHALLGFFPQAGSLITQDYISLIKQLDFDSLEDFFLQRNTSSYSSPIREHHLHPVFSTDVWQETVMQKMTAGSSMVVQGPPGSGKSQLICNLVSQALSTGKRILVVCQKRVALDVVYNRLSSMGLQNFLALVHDFRNDRKTLFNLLYTQIERIHEYQTDVNSLDSIHLDREFNLCSHHIDQIIEEFDNYRAALYHEQVCGVSAKELYLSCSPNSPFIDLHDDYKYFHLGLETEKFTQHIKNYCRYAALFDNTPWHNRKSFSSFSISDLRNLKNILHHLHRDYTKWYSPLNAHNISLSVSQVLPLLKKKDSVAQLVSLLSSKTRITYFLNTHMATYPSYIEFENLARQWTDCFHHTEPELTHHVVDLKALQKHIYRAQQLQKTWSGRLYQKLFFKHQKKITNALQNNQLLNHSHGTDLLLKKIQSRIQWEYIYHKVNSYPALHPLPSPKKNELHRWIDDIQAALQGKEIWNSIEFPNPNIFLHNPSNLYSKIKAIDSFLTTLHTLWKPWNYYLTENQIVFLIENGPQKKWEELLTQHFDSLCAFDQLQESLTKTQLSVIQKLQNHTRQGDENQWANLFLNSLKLAWLQHIETENPILRIVSSGRMAQLEQELSEWIIKKQKLTRDILLLRTQEQVLDKLSYNRLNNRITYRDLYHQTKKKRNRWPLRKLIKHFESEIFKLAPCWLASPETVSAIFPIKPLFDWVVFDEASQCFSEYGIPALYRGRQVMIAGDRMQLQPGDFFNTRWRSNDDDYEHVIGDSLLTLCEQHLPTVSLHGHYRSQYPELIDFSNQHFYQGKLNALPFYTPSDRPPAIEFHKLPGVWKNQSNDIEAEWIVQKVFQLNQEVPDKTVGIITFNIHQQKKIYDKIENLFAQQDLPVPSHIFIKNIENVQGDERDIILFSIGYATDEKGKIQAHFGSLNIEGGENRLNVAITRAREKIIIASSISAHQLSVSNTKNDGPKRLQDYLNFAHLVSTGKYTAKKIPIQLPNTYTSLASHINKMLTHNDKYEITKSPYQTIDLILKDHQNIHAVITDDHLYPFTYSTKYFHFFIPTRLKSKNWSFKKIFSRNVWYDHEKIFM